MPYYKTTFYRSCFNFGSEIKQSFDVVFFCDEKEYTSNHYHKFNNAAYEAASKQIPKSDPKESGLPLDSGWSSMLHSHKFEKLDIPWLNWKIQKPKPGKPVIACGYKTKEMWCGEHRSYRATGFYTLLKKKPGVTDPVMLEVFPDLDVPRWYVVPCNPEDALIVSGVGVAGNLSLISEIEVGDLVQWSDIMVKQEQYQYNESVKKYLENPDEFDFMSGKDIARYYMKEWLEKLGLTP